MKKTLVVLVGMLLLMLLGSTAMAESSYYTASGIGYSAYSYVSDDEGVIYCWHIDGYKQGITDIVIPATIDDKPVHFITQNAFKDCTTLRSVEIIGSKYFSGIGVGAFDNCTSLESITVPATCKDNGTYRNCTSLVYAHLSPNGGINDYMFKGCTALKTVEYSGSPTSIGNEAFRDCESLESFTIPSSVTIISPLAFANCRSLTEINIPSGVTGIGWSAFDGCEKLESISIPEGVTAISEYTFRNCKSLKSIVIPDTVTKLGEEAFANCTSLETAYIPGLDQYNISTGVFTGCTSLNEVTMGEGMIHIKEDMFANCTGLRSIYIPEGVTSIMNSAFSGCAKLEYVSLPSTLKSINPNAFTGCKSLDWIEIPLSISSYLSDNAFSDCGSIRVVFPNKRYTYNRALVNGDTSVNTFLGSNPVIYCYDGSAIQKTAQQDGYRVVLLDDYNTNYLDTGAEVYGPNVEYPVSYYAPGMKRTAIGWSWQFDNEDEYPEIVEGDTCYGTLKAPWDDGEYEVVAKAWDDDGNEIENRQTVVVAGIDKLGLAKITAPTSVAPGEDFTFTFEAVDHAEGYAVWIWPVGEGEPYVMDEMVDGPGTYTAPASYFEDGKMYRLDVQAFGTNYSMSDDSQHFFVIRNNSGNVDYSFTLENTTVQVNEPANFIIDAPGMTALRWRDTTNWGSDGSDDFWNDWWAADACVIDRYFDEPGKYAMQIMVSYDKDFDWENDDWDSHTWTAPSDLQTVTVTMEGRLSEVELTVPESVNQGSTLDITFSGLDHVAGYNAVIHDPDNWEDMYRASCEPGKVSLLTSKLTVGKTYAVEICAFGEAGWVSSYTCRDFTVNAPTTENVTISLANGSCYIGTNFNFSVLAPNATKIEFYTKASDQSDYELRCSEDDSSMQQEVAIWTMGNATLKAVAYYADGSSKNATKSIKVTSYGQVDAPTATFTHSIKVGETFDITVDTNGGGDGCGLYISRNGEDYWTNDVLTTGDEIYIDSSNWPAGDYEVSLLTWAWTGWEGNDAHYTLRIVGSTSSAISLPSGVTTIEDEAFMGDSAVEAVNISDSVTTIGSKAFADMDNLTFVYMGSNVKSIASDAFSGSDLVVIEAPEGSYACKWARSHGVGVRAY